VRAGREGSAGWDMDAIHCPLPITGCPRPDLLPAPSTVLNASSPELCLQPACSALPHILHVPAELLSPLSLDTSYLVPRNLNLFSSPAKLPVNITHPLAPSCTRVPIRHPPIHTPDLRLAALTAGNECCHEP
jgi:hypothetical protein